VVVWLAAGIVAIYLPILNETILRIVLTLPVMLFIPGYCLIAAFFPKEGDIDLLERILLSIGLSIAVVPLVGLGLNFTPGGIRLDSIVISLTLFTWVMILVANYRRASLPSEERFRMSFPEIASTIRKELFPPGSSRVNQLLNTALALAILTASLTTIYVIVFPKEGERFTEFYILGENRTIASYPDSIIPEKNYPIFLGIGNHEFTNITYTTEIWVTRSEFNISTNTSRITVMDPIDQLSIILAHNETRVIPYTLSLKKTGYDRIEFLLFNESIPGSEVSGSDRINASYRNLHLSVTVQ
jgi:uncharacterized membrane protein